MALAGKRWMMRQPIQRDAGWAVFWFSFGITLLALSFLVGCDSSAKPASSQDSARDSACWDAMWTHYRNGGSDDPPSECRGVPAATMEKFRMQLLGDQ